LQAFICDLLRNGVTYGGGILHADQCRTCVTPGLGLMSIGVIIGEKMYLIPFQAPSCTCSSVGQCVRV